MSNAKIYSFANPPAVDQSQLHIPQNVRLVIVQNEEENGEQLRTDEVQLKEFSPIGDKVIDIGNATAYIIIVDTKIGDDVSDLPLTYGGTKPKNRANVDVAGYQVYKLNVHSTQTIQSDKIPLDLTAAGTLQELDISNPNNPVVGPVS